MKFENEPTLEKIEDYNSNESDEKRKTVRLIIGGLLLFAIVLGAIKFSNDTVSDYIGTSENPGISLSHH